MKTLKISDLSVGDWVKINDKPRKVMKQYLSPEQTAKLIELGLPKPKNRLVKQRFDRSTSSWIVVGEESYYSIGELIEMLPRDRGGCSLIIDGNLISEKWAVYYEGAKGFSRDELIDALYEMAIKLKEEGVMPND